MGRVVVRVVSVNVGLPRQVLWHGRSVTTGIFKAAVGGPVRASGYNLEGDGQADLTVHGGADKAVYVYQAEHYAPWQTELGRALPWGMFGENLTLEGFPMEDEISIGDRVRIGSAEFVVTQPRLPCFKLGIRFDDVGMVRRFVIAGRTGCYLRILKEGNVAAGDQVERVAQDPACVSVADVTRLLVQGRHDADAFRRALRSVALPSELRSAFEQQLERPTRHVRKPTGGRQL
jgi:MOSC domain-containing protein YiiM